MEVAQFGGFGEVGGFFSKEDLVFIYLQEVSSFLAEGVGYSRLTIAGAVFKVFFGLSLEFELSQPDFVD